MMMVVSTAVKAGGEIAKGQAEAAEFNAAAANASSNAQIARDQTNANEETLRRQNKVRLGMQRAVAGESGFDPSSGSMLDMQGKSAGELELDALTTRYEGTLKALSFDNESASLRTRAKAAKRSGYMSAFGSIFQSAAGGMQRSGFGSRGPGWSGTQTPAPVETRTIPTS
jgi:hypothetical protein